MRDRYSINVRGLVTAAALLVVLTMVPVLAHGKQPMSGQIVVDAEHPQWLRYHEGGPFYMAGPGDPEGFLYRGRLQASGTRRGDQKKLIRRLSKTGANSIYLMAVRSHGGDGDDTHNPYIGHNPANELNPKVLNQWEKWFKRMDRNGIVIFFIFYDDSARIWDTGDKVSPAERSLFEQLVDRFEHHKHLIWVVAEEYQERYTAARISRIAAVIRKADDYDHPIAVHKLTGLTFDEFANDKNIDQFAIQYKPDSVEEVHEAMQVAWREAKGRYNINLAEVHPPVTGAAARKRAWAAAMSGAYVMAYEMDIASTKANDMKDLGRLARFMESTDFFRMAPRDSLAMAETEYMLAKPGKSYIAYSSKGNGPLGVKNLKAGTYLLYWFDAVTGTEFEDMVELAAGDHRFPRPSGYGKEVALHLLRLDSEVVE